MDDSGGEAGWHFGHGVHLWRSQDCWFVIMFRFHKVSSMFGSNQQQQAGPEHKLFLSFTSQTDKLLKAFLSMVLKCLQDHTI
mmetsp:Transcript_24722/g.44547  ORF Transcript_24722/g.44547 Transcript_24722/m.44547 type:complete len:82 (+) Transcript_24722:1520-1765(+)